MELASRTYTIKLGDRCGNLVLTIDRNEEGKIVGIKSRPHRPGTCVASLVDSVCYLLCKGLKTGRISPQRMADSLVGQSCGSHIDYGDFPNLGCVDAIGRVVASSLNLEVKSVSEFISDKKGMK